MYATLRLPTPLKVTEWGSSPKDVDTYPDGCTQRDIRGDEQTRSLGPRPDAAGEGPEKNEEHRSSFVDPQFLVTLQVSPMIRSRWLCGKQLLRSPFPSMDFLPSAVVSTAHTNMF